jgi:hypothetical protein
MTQLRRIAACLAILGAGTLQAQERPAASAASMDRIRAALERYQDPIVAVHDGYFSTVACVAFPTAGQAGQMAYPAGGMGVHFLNPGLIGTPLDSLHPQVLIYQPVRDSLRLVAAEWFVPVKASPTKPRMFGRDFDGPMEGHHPIMPPELHHWDLHVWLRKNNPAGMFSPTNPELTCPDQAYTLRETAPKMVVP